MSNKDYRDMLDIVDYASVDPTAFIRPAMRVIDEGLADGFNVVTPNSPFINLLEAASTTTVASMEKAAVLNRRQYRTRAQTPEDLYYHMSDRDYKGRFGLPDNAIFHYALPYEWLLQTAVTTTTGERVIYIPKDTQWSANGINFYHHYDIRIQLLDSGDVQVYFVYDEESPIYKPDTLLIETREIWLDGQRLIELSIPVEQLTLETISSPITANGFNLSHVISEQFYYCRAFTHLNGVWTEVKTTHSEQVYDPSEVTVVLKVTDKTVNAKIPDVYINTGMAGTECMLLIYTTRGALGADLENYAIGDFSVQFDDALGENLDYWGPLSSNPLNLIYSRSKLSGGRNALTFSELRDKVVYDKYGKDVAVTDKELEVAMRLRGYGIYKQKDTITERVFVTTKELSPPKSKFISSGPAITNKNVLIDSKRGDVSQFIKNGDIYTLKPGALFRSIGYDVVIASDTERTAIEGLNNFDLCDKLNNEAWFYTPFYYVVDDTSSVTRVDAYYLDRPRRLSTSFVNFNPNLDYAVKTKDTAMSFDGSKYTIDIVAEHPNGLVGLFLQMKCYDRDGNLLHLNAVQNVIDGTTSSFRFELNTNLSIDRYNRFQCADMVDSSNTPVDTWIELEKEFEFLYLVEEGTVTPSPFDPVIETSGLANPVSGVTYDKITFSFGTHLANLNTKAKTVQMPGDVLRHTADVPLFWEKDIYLKDAEGSVFEFNEDTNEVDFSIVHNMGDPVLDADGEQVYKHRKDDPILDSNGNVTYTEQPYLSQRLRLFLIDAKYLFASDTRVTQYRDDIPEQIIANLDDMKGYSPEMIEKTELLFEPTGTANLTLVTTASERQSTANTAVKFSVKYTMQESRYNDIQLRDSIKTATKASIASFLNTDEFSMSALISNLDKISDNVNRNVEVTSSLPGKVVKIQDGSSVFSVKSRLVPSSNNQLTIEDDIDIEITK